MPVCTTDFVNAILLLKCAILNWFTLWRVFFSLYGNINTWNPKCPVYGAIYYGVTYCNAEIAVSEQEVPRNQFIFAKDFYDFSIMGVIIIIKVIKPPPCPHCGDSQGFTGIWNFAPSFWDTPLHSVNRLPVTWNFLHCIRLYTHSCVYLCS